MVATVLTPGMRPAPPGRLHPARRHGDNAAPSVFGTILIGFKAGAAVTIALTQLPKLFGVPGGGDHFFEQVVVLIGRLHLTNGVVLAIGLVSLAMLVACDRWLPGRPAETTSKRPAVRPESTGESSPRTSKAS